MNIELTIAPECPDGKRAVFINGGLSHHIREHELQETLREANYDSWKRDAADGTKIGCQLYRFLNGSGGQLDSLIEKAGTSGEPLFLYLTIPYEINALPFELLHNGLFLAQRHHPGIYLIRKVTERNTRKPCPAERRPLKVLFMACSPLNLKPHEVLQFEKEEERILSGVEKFPVEIITVDSGSLTGLSEQLYEHQGKRFDIVHISGHAGHDHELGPVFYMENEIGELDRITPARLWDEALRHFTPRLLFLSGCSTGKSDKANGAESFAHSMVERGVPLVLGWGLPVSDEGATAMATRLYKYLGMGQSLTEALAKARQDLEQSYHPWPLLRLFTDGSPLDSFIASGQKIRYVSPRTTRYKTLKDGQVRVLDKGFVGRRREIQKGIRTLKGIPDEEGVLRYGVMIRGPAGVGKSCLAGKLIERFKDLELVVFHGRITGEADILVRLKHLFDRLGESHGLEVITSDKTYEDKIKELFRSTFQKVAVVLYFDDFEQNLVNRYDSCWEIQPEVIRIIRPLLQALDWYDETKARLMITSRYPFELEHEGENLHEKLTDITLTSFRDADLLKKCAELPHISASVHREMYLKYGCGNPRLLEWLEIIAADENKYDPVSLAKELEGRNEDYIREYLADFLARIEGGEFNAFLRQASVYRRPVSEDAFAAIGDAHSLERGVGLTLVEKEQAIGQKARYWVNPVIREKQWKSLPQPEQKRLHQMALDWYDRTISASDSPDYDSLKEAVHHALSSDNISAACRHAITLGKYLNHLLLYENKKELQKAVADGITAQVIEEAISKKDGNIATLLNELGITYRVLGDAQKAIEYYEKALEIDFRVFGDKHPNVAIDYNNLGLAYRYLGAAQKAIEYYEKALEIGLKVFGDQHPDVARYYNNLGAAYRYLGDAQKAIEYYEKALEIDLKVFGNQHPDVAIRYNNIGLAYQDLGAAQKAIEYYEKALEISLKVFGDQHPDVARYYNNFGAAYGYLGDAQKAIEYYEKALEIDLKVFGNKHPDVARDYNNLGAAYGYLGDAKKAIAYYEKALEIDFKVFGDQHPNVAIDYNNLGEAYRVLGDAQKAIEYLEKALIICRAIYGDNHPSTKTVEENLQIAKNGQIMNAGNNLDLFIKDCALAAAGEETKEKLIGWEGLIAILVYQGLKLMLPEIKEWLRLGAQAMALKRQEIKKKLVDYALEKELDFPQAERAADIVSQRLDEEVLHVLVKTINPLPR